MSDEKNLKLFVGRTLSDALEYVKSWEHLMYLKELVKNGEMTGEELLEKIMGDEI